MIKVCNRNYWISMVFVFVNIFMGQWVLACMFLTMATVWYAAETVIKEIRNGKCETGKSNEESTVVETP